MAVRYSHEEAGAVAPSVFPHLCYRPPAPRNGRVLEQLGTYDPMILDVNARGEAQQRANPVLAERGSQAQRQGGNLDQEVRQRRHPRGEA